MRPDSAGRYCDHCAKTVIDFTQMTDRQVLAHLQLHGPGCGQLRSDQLNRVLSPPHRPVTQRWEAALLAWAGALFGWPQQALGKLPQEHFSTEQLPAPQQNQDGTSGRDSLRVSGQVIDESGEVPIRWPVHLFYSGSEVEVVRTHDDGEFVFSAVPGQNGLETC